MKSAADCVLLSAAERELAEALFAQEHTTEHYLSRNNCVNLGHLNWIGWN